VEIKQLANWEQ